MSHVSHRTGIAKTPEVVYSGHIVAICALFIQIVEKSIQKLQHLHSVVFKRDYLVCIFQGTLYMANQIV